MIRFCIVRVISIVIAFTIIFQQSGFSTSLSVPSDTSDFKIGLVLSGGGAKGIAHIGVLKVLEEAGIQPDFIAGTSMGSIIGALYSIGYSTDQMEELALTTNWDELFTDRPNRRLLSMFEKKIENQFILSFPISSRGINLPTGLVIGQNIFSWLTYHTWPARDISDFSNLPIPFATVATNLETGEAVVFRSGYLPDAIRASISFPTAMIPHIVDGTPLLDGGLIRNLPVQEVLDMGADYVIAVDVSTPLRLSDQLSSIVAILNQAVNYRVIERVEDQKALADYVIEARDLDEYNVTNFDNASEMIEIGEAAAREHLERLKVISTLQTRERDRSELLGRTDDVYISDISVSGNENVPGDVIRADLEFLAGSVASASDIENAINQIYGSRLFYLITYRLHPLGNNAYNLEVRVIENKDDLFRLGARYENNTQASILFHTSFRNLIHRGSNLRLNLRLGRDAGLMAEYHILGGASPGFSLNTRLSYDREEIDFYSGSDRISSLTSHLFRGDMFTGTFFNKNFLLGFGVRKDFNFFSDMINPDEIPFSDTDYHAVYGKFLLDTYNRESLPSRGQRLLLHATFSDDLFLSPLNFNEQHFYFKSWYPVHESLSLQHTIYLGRSYGEELPWNYWFSPNRRNGNLGMIRFGGFERYELSGRNIQMVSAGIQYEIIRHRFLRLDAYYGNTFDNWNWNISDNRYRTGISFSVGALTILGPLELIISNSARNPVLFELQIGYDF